MSVSASASWHDEKPRHAKDLARELERIRKRAGVPTIEDVEEFYDVGKFAGLGESVLSKAHRRAAPTFVHGEHFRRIVAKTHRDMFGAASKSTASKGMVVKPFSPIRPPLKEGTSRSANSSGDSDSDENEASMSLGALTVIFVVIILTFLALLIGGIIVCDVCAENFRAVTTT